jgi:hypothetical protein
VQVKIAEQQDEYAALRLEKELLAQTFLAEREERDIANSRDLELQQRLYQARQEECLKVNNNFSM